jgi:hypothetical protein
MVAGADTPCHVGTGNIAKDERGSEITSLIWVKAAG